MSDLSQPSEAIDHHRLVEDCLHHLEHVLPSQGPIKDFVHHNTLHGFQHLPFDRAVAAARAVSGASGYLPAAEYRRLFRQGRIDRSDVEAALRQVLTTDLDAVLLPRAGAPVRRLDVLAAQLIEPLEAVAVPRLAWCLAEDAQDESLWAACLDALDIAPLAPPAACSHHEPAVIDADALWLTLSARVGDPWTLRELLRHLSGEDVQEKLQTTLIRHLASHLDQGLAAWHHPARPRGFYSAWRHGAIHDPAWGLEAMPDAGREIGALPARSFDALVQELACLGLAESRWPAYLERLALELPGWSGMVLWRDGHPGYADAPAIPVSMVDYLAVRLILERLFTQDLIRRHWGLPVAAPVLPRLGREFKARSAELAVRHAWGEGDLPEALAAAAEGLIRRAGAGNEVRAEAWQGLARDIAAQPRQLGHWRQAARQAWPLYRLCRVLGITAGEVSASVAKTLLAELDGLDEERRGFIWLHAYERHYREQIFAALAANRGRWRGHGGLPAAQLVFCMDDREEGMRRHVEEVNPALETLGGAAHFAVFQNFRGLDDRTVTPLCPVVPVVIKPAHEVRETARPEAAAVAARHRRRLGWRLAWAERIHQETRRRPILGGLIAVALAPFVLMSLGARLIDPAGWGRWREGLRRRFDQVVPTRLELNAAADAPAASPEAPRLGFTDAEQVERVAGFLASMGFTHGFAPLVAIVGHGSNSQNNPHLAAYDCGACSGRHSGPNARLFAAMANRPEVRALLAARGIVVPASTWFLGAEHNTADDIVTWYDQEDIPPHLAAAFAKLGEDLEAAGRAHAQERCRRLFSAPVGISAEAAFRHVSGRRHDFSQPRPELGHVTNAAAFIGRRTMSRGAFFDRRAFLISYDPSQDPEGRILERHLVVNGAVGAGISLEYYFSTVDNERYGCGSKIMHNVSGMLGVMQGANSDLRPGLPKQMIEIHEAMRLLVVVEQTTALVTAIYQRQPAVQELVGNGWVVVACQDPQSGEISLFDPARGWQPWQGRAELPTVAASADWFAGQREPLPPVLLTRPLELAAPASPPFKGGDGGGMGIAPSPMLLAHPIPTPSLPLKGRGHALGDHRG